MLIVKKEIKWLKKKAKKSFRRPALKSKEISSNLKKDKKRDNYLNNIKSNKIKVNKNKNRI